MRDRLELLRRGGDIVCYILADRDAAAHVQSDVTIVHVPVDDWNMQLSPWRADACFKGGDDFGGGAGEYLAELAAAIPGFEKENGVITRRRMIAGYSLAGLCALYALYETDVFSGAVSASGSMWFDLWLEYMRAHKPCGRAAYLSVGDKEKRTRNLRLAAVEECTLKARDILAGNGLRTEFKLEKGNHFAEPEMRLARGVDRLAVLMEEHTGETPNI